MNDGKNKIIRRLPAEWEPQAAILACWPHAGTDWAPVLDRVLPAYAAMISAISQDEPVILIIPFGGGEAVERSLAEQGTRLNQIRCVEAESDDTWARDFGPIGIYENGRRVLWDFRFNGWGGKFAAERDNALNRTLWQGNHLPADELRPVDFVLEGGSIESDGAGTLLTSTQCLGSLTRNPGFSLATIEKRLCEWFGLRQVHWLKNGHLEGDDTDAHIDTLVRLAPENTLVYVRCDDPADSHYAALSAMENEIRGWRTLSGAPYQLKPLPWPRAQFDEEGQRLPATYANFLITPRSVLVPVYNDPADELALATVAAAFPGRRMVAIDATGFILQHGAVHCLTQQIPGENVE
jgi:agmatine deiminase